MIDMKHLKRFEDRNESVIPELLNANPDAKEIWNKALDFCKDIINNTEQYSSGDEYLLNNIIEEIEKNKI